MVVVRTSLSQLMLPKNGFRIDRSFVSMVILTWAKVRLRMGGAGV
jgi:hypothetical protein